MRKIGAVAIGRNEGLRLKLCLASLARGIEKIVYVDSGSTDDSVKRASEMGCDVVELDRRLGFTAARARNAGATRLFEIFPAIEFIQFIDGDCELFDTWLSPAISLLDQSPDVAVVCGRRRERHRDATKYNLMCDLEWDGPKGIIDECGGDLIVRASVYREIGGFNDSLIAGEDPEFCVRVRKAGWHIVRLAEDMTLHDAAMFRFTQWWKRSVRTGHAYAQVGRLHPDYWRRSRQRAWGWGLVLPSIAIGLAPFTSGYSLLLLGLYAVSFARTSISLINQGIDRREAGIHAAFLTLSKFSQVQGMLMFWKRHVASQGHSLIEYK